MIAYHARSPCTVSMRNHLLQKCRDALTPEGVTQGIFQALPPMQLQVACDKYHAQDVLAEPGSAAVRASGAHYHLCMRHASSAAAAAMHWNAELLSCVIDTVHNSREMHLDLILSLCSSAM